jgi:hypothetical protein
MTNPIEQLSLLGNSTTEKRAELIPYTLPKLHFNNEEQFMLALQRRDQQALHLLLSKQMNDDALKTKDKFIANYLAHCNALEKKHGELIIQTIKGKCASTFCPNRYLNGISVSVHAAKHNKQLWVFDLIMDTDKDNCIELCRCYEMKVCKEYL